MKPLIKTVLILTVFSILPIKMSAQTGEDQTEKMINNGLLAILKKDQEYIAKGILRKNYFETSCIWVDHLPEGFEFSQEIIDMKLKCVSIYGLTKEQKKNGINGIQFTGFKLEGNYLRICFAEVGVFQKGNTLHMGVGEGYVFGYTYSCEKNEWILTKTPSAWSKDTE